MKKKVYVEREREHSTRNLLPIGYMHFELLFASRLINFHYFKGKVGVTIKYLLSAQGKFEKLAERRVIYTALHSQTLNGSFTIG